MLPAQPRQEQPDGFQRQDHYILQPASVITDVALMGVRQEFLAIFFD